MLRVFSQFITLTTIIQIFGLKVSMKSCYINTVYAFNYFKTNTVSDLKLCDIDALFISKFQSCLYIGCLMFTFLNHFCRTFRQIRPINACIFMSCSNFSWSPKKLNFVLSRQFFKKIKTLLQSTVQQTITE